MKYTVVPGGVCAAKGFSAAGVHCGIRHNRLKKDLALIKADVRCAAAGVAVVMGNSPFPENSIALSRASARRR